MSRVVTPYYDAAGIVIFHGDAREVLPSLTGVDAVLTDPPYGMAWDTDTSRFTGGHRDNVAKHGQGRSDWGAVRGDNAAFDPSPWIAFPKVVLWGSNHFGARLPVGTTLVWIKRFDEAFGSFLSDAEVAWMKGGHGVYCRRDTSLMGETGARAHPTQKPVGLLAWCIQKMGDTSLILDPYCGSGSTLRAAKNLGRRAIGIEIEERYCEVAANRMRQEVLFAAETAP